MTTQTRLMLVFTGMCLIWGSTFVALKMGMEGTPPLLGVALRHLLASAILFAVIRLKRFTIPTDPLAWKQYLTLGLLNFSLSYSLTYLGAQFIYSNITALLWASFPITTALVAHFTLPAERLRPLKSAGIAVGFGGVLLIFYGYGFGQSQNLLLGMSLVMAAVVAGTWPGIYLKRTGARSNPIVLNGVATGIGGLATLVVSLAFEDVGSMVWSPGNLGLLLYLALFGTVLAWVAYYYLLEHIEVVKVSFVGFISPVLAIFMGMLILGEHLPSTVYLGAALVLVGIFLADARRYLRLFVRG
ncbi:MAG: DMT family transporter [Candidatus Marinimicrobia bacterium]|nr:DMT family transporter [Candidatus Neomarinimicrobiota bacterium]